jgi:succinylarginine dihydrolase
MTASPGGGEAWEANADGLIGPSHNYAGLSVGNLASERNFGAVSDPRAAALEGLTKMRRVAEMGLPQFVLPPHDRPNAAFLASVGLPESTRYADSPLVGAAWSASAMWAANAATVTPSADSADGRLHLTPANLLAQLHRSLEPEQTARSLRALFPDPERFVVHAPLHAHGAFADEGAANHVRLCGSQGGPGVELFVWGRTATVWEGRYPARQTWEACEALVRLHGSRRPVLAQQSRRAIEAGAFHNDVVCVGTRTCLFHHEAAFKDTAAVHDAVRRAADGLFEPVFVVVAEADLPLAEAVTSYLFNSQLLDVPGEDRLTLLCPVEVAETPSARATAERLVAGNGPIGRVEYVDVRQSMRNGGGPACLRLRVVLTAEELAATNPAQRLTPELYDRLSEWVRRRYRDRLSPADLGDPALITESRSALDELTGLLGLGSNFYPFQRA